MLGFGGELALLKVEFDIYLVGPNNKNLVRNLLAAIRIDNQLCICMSPVSPVFHTAVTVSIGLKQEHLFLKIEHQLHSSTPT